MYMNRQPENTLRQIVSKYLMIGFMVGSSGHLVMCSYRDCKNQQAAAQASTALGDRYALDGFKPRVRQLVASEDVATYPDVAQTKPKTKLQQLDENIQAMNRLFD